MQIKKLSIALSLCVFPVLAACGDGIDEFRDSCKRDSYIKIIDQAGWSEYLSDMKEGFDRNAGPKEIIKIVPTEKFSLRNDSIKAQRLSEKTSRIYKNNFFIRRRSDESLVAEVGNNSITLFTILRYMYKDCIFDFPENYIVYLGGEHEKGSESDQRK